MGKRADREEMQKQFGAAKKAFTDCYDYHKRLRNLAPEEKNESNQTMAKAGEQVLVEAQTKIADDFGKANVEAAIHQIDLFEEAVIREMEAGNQRRAKDEERAIGFALSDSDGVAIANATDRFVNSMLYEPDEEKRKQLIENYDEALNPLYAINPYYKALAVGVVFATIGCLVAANFALALAASANMAATSTFTSGAALAFPFGLSPGAGLAASAGGSFVVGGLFSTGLSGRNKIDTKGVTDATEVAAKKLQSR